MNVEMYQYDIDIHNIEKRLRVFEDILRRHTLDIENSMHGIKSTYEYLIDAYKNNKKYCDTIDDSSSMDNLRIIKIFIDNLNTMKKSLNSLKDKMYRSASRLYLLAVENNIEWLNMSVEYNKFVDSIIVLKKIIDDILEDDIIKSEYTISKNRKFIRDVDIFCNRCYKIDINALEDIISKENYKKLIEIESKISDNIDRMNKLLKVIKNKTKSFEE